MKVLLAIFVATLSMTGLHAQSSAEKPAKDEKAPSLDPVTDVLHFCNGDTLHGALIGFDEQSNVLWKSPEASEPIRFSTEKIRRIVRNRGLGHMTAGMKSTLTLTNGDVLPGSIMEADKAQLVFASVHLGKLTIPMDVISEIQFNPYGGNLLYQGPHSSEGWKIIHPGKPAEKHQEANNQQAQDKQKPAAEDAPEKSEWTHIVNAWYSGSEHSCLALEDSLPDRCRLRFKLAWRGSRLYTGIAIHADLDAAPQDKNHHLRTNFAATVGNAYVLMLSSNYAALHSCSFDEDGNASNERIGQSVSLELNERQEAVFELRIDRPNKQLLFYLDGAYRTKWDLGDHYTGRGNAFAISKIHDNADLRLSDMVISKWNGLKDSAMSMSSRKRDVILLSNGLDRFSGTFKGLHNGVISFDGSYENRINIPAKEVEELKFATDKTRVELAQEPPKSAYFLIPPHGRITGIPQQSENSHTKISSELLGELSLDMRYVNLIEFSDHNSMLDIWNENF